MTQASNPAGKTGVLPTDFVSAEETARLKAALDLALEELDQVAGGIIDNTPCMCVNCCQH